MSIRTFFLANVMGTWGRIPWDLVGWPSQACIFVEDGCRIRVSRFFQTRVDIMHMDAPSSTMHRCMTKFWIDIRIWKEMVDGICGSPFSVSNVINLESKGSTAPRAASNTFRCIGHILSTSREDMEVGVWAKSSIML